MADYHTQTQDVSGACLWPLRGQAWLTVPVQSYLKRCNPLHCLEFRGEGRKRRREKARRGVVTSSSEKKEGMSETMLQSYEVSKQMLGRERDGGIGI